MRSVCLDNLPRHKSGACKGKIDWKQSIGCVCNFTYDDIRGEIKITAVGENNLITFVYNNKEFTKRKDHIKKCTFSDVVGKINRDHIYRIGEIVNGQEILNQTRGCGNKKTYIVRCIKCEFIAESKIESDLKSGNGCVACAGNRLIVGYNDIYTTHKDIAMLMENENDRYENCVGSIKNVMFKCNVCGNTNKMSIHNVVSRGFSCKKCGDGISYPNKFIFNILSQLKVDFETEKCFSWSDNKRYDFFVNNNIIIEAHGLQHYDKGFGSCGGESLEDVIKNDNYKLNLAKEKYLKNYIIIDCRESSLEWIKKSLMESELPKLLNFKEDDINWLECHSFSMSSRAKEACDLWESGVGSTKKIGEIMRLNQTTVRRYLKNGKTLGLCNYNPEDTRKNNGTTTGSIVAKRVIMCKDGEVIGNYESALWLSQNSVSLFGVKLLTSKISLVCCGKRPHHRGYTFTYL